MTAISTVKPTLPVKLLSAVDKSNAATARLELILEDSNGQRWRMDALPAYWFDSLRRVDLPMERKPATSPVEKPNPADWQPVIETGVPIPARRDTDISRRIPIGKLMVGQSMFVPDYVREHVLVCRNVWQIGTGKGRKFTMRYREEGGVRGTRIWRVA